MTLDCLRTAIKPWCWDPILRRSLLFLLLILAMGTIGYTSIEGWSPWRSFFFTLITLTTVGYGDYGLSPAGEKFTAIVMIGGIATASYCLTQILNYFATRVIHPERKAMQQIRRLSGHHIVCGAGSMGVRVIERLEAQGEVVVAIDVQEQKVEKLRDRGLIVLAGDATTDAILLQAGIERARSLAAVTASDAANAMLCLTANSLVPNLAIVARAHTIDSETKLRRAGARTVISPTIYGGDGIAEFMARPDVARIMFGGCGTDTAICNPMRIIEIEVESGDANDGVAISDFTERHPALTVVACRPQRGAFEMKPTADRVMVAGDSLMVAGMVADLSSVRRVAAAAA